MNEFMKKPFFCQKKPFVWHKHHSNVPSVRKYLPFVGFGHSTRGFTLMELMITLTVAGILAVIAAPSFQTFLRSNRLTTTSNDLLADLNFARAEAVKRQGGQIAGQNGQVVVCVSSNGTDCSTSSGTWSDGWIIFWDQDRSGTFSTAANDVMLKAHLALPSSLTISTTPTDTRLVAFDSLGARCAPTAVTAPIAINITDPNLGKTNTVTVDLTGQGSVS